MEKKVGEAMTEERPRKQWSFWRKWCNHGFSFWCKKYFWEGQLKHGATDKDCEDVDTTSGPFSGMSSKKRKLLGLLIPAMFFHFWYWSIMAYKNLFYVFADTYPMAITMVFGSVISGIQTVIPR